MRHFFSLAIQLAACLALPIARRASWTSSEVSARPRGLEVLKYSHDNAYTEFSISCPGCFGDNSAADESLVFRLKVLPIQGGLSSFFSLNNIHFTIYDEVSDISARAISALDTHGTVHTVGFDWARANCTSSLSTSASSDADQVFHFNITEVDAITTPRISFTAIMRPDFAEPRLMRLSSDTASDFILFSESEDSYSEVELFPASEEHGSSEIDTVDLSNEIDTLRLLEDEATELRNQISLKKAALTKQLRENRDKLCLKHLIQECEGVVCAARVIAQRVCDKLGINVDPAFGFTGQRADSHQQYLNLKGVQTGSVSHKDKNHTSYSFDGFHMPLMLTENGSVRSLHPAVYIMQALAALLGLSALYALIKRKCVSARTRAERAADREERQNKRTYRRAARRALMRKRWDTFVGTLNCFRVKEDAEPRDYEEKRALILQDAFLEQDPDLMEKGEIMEAEIRELRCAHEIVSSLVQVDSHRFELVTPIHDPPPPMVPLPYTPAPRSRASTYTLPSYTSEVLPDYTSRISRDRRSSGSTIGITPSTSEADASSTHSRSEHSGSSVPNMSPRPSAETLRTRKSGDTHGQSL